MAGTGIGIYLVVAVAIIIFIWLFFYFVPLGLVVQCRICKGLRSHMATHRNANTEGTTIHYPQQSGECYKSRFTLTCR